MAPRELSKVGDPTAVAAVAAEKHNLKPQICGDFWVLQRETGLVKLCFFVKIH